MEVFDGVLPFLRNPCNKPNHASLERGAYEAFNYRHLDPSQVFITKKLAFRYQFSRSCDLLTTARYQRGLSSLPFSSDK